MPETPPLPLRVFAAGSLRGALAEMFADRREFQFHFGPAGRLRREIENGAACDLFLSANLTHPEALARRHPGAEVICFTANAVVALARRRLAMTPERFLDVLLDPAVRLGTSTPGADPGGDYAMALFAQAGRLRPGADEMLADKAQPLVGGWGPAPADVPAGESPVVAFLREGLVVGDLCYCSTALAGVRALGEGFTLVHPPEALAVRARYGGVSLAAVPDRRAAAEHLLAALTRPPASAVFGRYGFAPPD